MTTQLQPERDSESDRAVGHLFDRQLDSCPQCGSTQLEPVVENETQDVHFLCAACTRCWHVELGFVRRITPITCSGCPERERCEATYAADKARLSQTP